MWSLWSNCEYDDCTNRLAASVAPSEGAKYKTRYLRDRLTRRTFWRGARWWARCAHWLAGPGSDLESPVYAPKPTLRPRLVLPAIRMRVRRDRAAFVGCPGPPNGRNVVVRQIGHAAFVVGGSLYRARQNGPWASEIEPESSVVSCPELVQAVFPAPLAVLLGHARRRRRSMRVLVGSRRRWSLSAVGRYRPLAVDVLPPIGIQRTR